jgi:hypothetical protein
MARRGPHDLGKDRWALPEIARGCSLGLGGAGEARSLLRPMEPTSPVPSPSFLTAPGSALGDRQWLCTPVSGRDRLSQSCLPPAPVRGERQGLLQDQRQLTRCGQWGDSMLCLEWPWERGSSEDCKCLMGGRVNDTQLAEDVMSARGSRGGWRGL